MRFLIASAVPKDPTLGSAGTLCSTVDALRELGHEVHEIWEDDLRPRRIRHGNLHYLLELPRRYRDAVCQRVAQAQFDVVQVSQPHAWLAAREHQRQGSPGLFINRSHGWEEHVYRVMQRWRGQNGEPRKPWWRRAASQLMRQLLQRNEKRVVRYSDGIVVGSVDDRDFLIGRYRLPPERILAVPPGLPSPFLDTPSAPLTLERLGRWLYVGQFTACKGPEVVAGVINQALPHHPRVEMTWVTQRAYHTQITQLLLPELRARVHLRDWMGRSDLIRTYDHHGVYLFPSYFEGFAKTFLEAMARGLCVVATAVDGMRQAIRTGENGYLSPPGDVSGLAAQARSLMDNPDLAFRLGSAARCTALSYTWRSSVQTLVQFCQELQQRKRHPPTAHPR